MDRTTKKRTLQKDGGRNGRLFLLGGLLGAAVFLLVYGLVPLDVTRTDWIVGGYIDKDVLQHYLGWFAYRESPLAFPLCIATTINAPTGVSIAFTDSIPLFAVVFRLVEGILPASFQYFGLFVFACFFLQGGCAAMLVGLFVDGTLKPVLASLLFVLNPILLERAFRHTALTAQFLILLALYLYFDAKHKNAPPSLWFVALSALAILIHPYFVPMVLAVTFASAVEYGFKNKKVLHPLGTLIAAMLACVLAAYAIGYFHTGASRTIGYGYFSMNLNALFNPVSRGVDSWSLLLPHWKQGLGTYEGFNYLGLGTLLAFGAAVLDHLIHAKKRATWTRIKAHGGLLFACICLTVFAVSNVVVLNSFVLFSVELPWKLVDLLSMLRASGRLFWPVNYLIVLCAALFLCRRVKAKHATVALAAAVAIQAADSSPALLQKHRAFADVQPTYSSPFVSPFWATAAMEYGNIFSFEPEGIEDALYLQLLAAQNGMTSNDQFFARHDDALHTADVERMLDAVRAGNIDQDTLYITSDAGVFFRNMELFLDDCLCAQVDENWYVFAPWNDAVRRLDPSSIEVYSDVPFTVADYSDDDWTGGVWNQDKNLICLYDNETNRARLDGATALRAGDAICEIVHVNYDDPGWILITLDQSGEALRGLELEIVRGN